MSAIIGGSPYGRNDAVVDTSRAVLLDHVDVVAVATGRRSAFGPVVDDELSVGLGLAGRFNRRNERSDLLYLMEADGAARLVAEILGLGARGMPDIWARLAERLDDVPGLAEFLDRLDLGDGSIS